MSTAPTAPPKAVRPQRGAPPPAPAAANGNGGPSPRRQLATGKVAAGVGHRVVVFGPGGVGKTTLAVSAPGPVAVIDLDESLSRLLTKLTAFGLADNFEQVAGVQSWADLREVLAADGWDRFKTIVIDSLTRAEDLAIVHTLATVPNERDQRVKHIEGYGYGKGYQHVYDTFLPLLADLDRHCRAGRHVLLVCHECNSTVPNPMGADWIRYEPRLQTSNTGKASIRLRVKEWADHVLFVGYDVDVKDGKGVGAGTATLYPTERPHFMAKSRTLTDARPLDQCFAHLWQDLLV